MDLKKWLPFKFKRTDKNERRGQSQLPTPPSEQLTPFQGDLWNQMRTDPFQLMRADPWQVMQQMMREPFGMLSSNGRWFGDFSPSGFQPHIDVVDQKNAVVVTAELPGMSKDDVELTVNDQALTLTGEKRLESSTDEEGCYRTERAYGYFHRVIPLPREMDLKSVDAKFDRGVLTVRIPKTEGAPSDAQRVAIK